MFNYIRNGLAILGLLLPLVTQAHPCSSAFAGMAAPKVCDVTFSSIPTFTNLCLGIIQQGQYTIRNNTPVPLKLNYIRIRDNDALPGVATAIIAAPTNSCGTSLASGAFCNMLLNLQPLALGTFNRILEIGIDSRQVQLDGPTITTAVNCTTPTPPLVPVSFPPPFVPPPAPGVPPPVVPIIPDPGPGVPPVPPASLFSASILGATTVTSTGLTVVNGDVDVSPGTAITGFPPGTVVNGSLHSADATAATAQADALAYFNSAVALPCTTNLTGQDLGGMTLTPGVYCFNSSAQLTGALTLNGGPTSSFTFQIGSTLTTAAASSVVLTGGVTNNNITWAVGSSATLGTTTAFQGIIDAAVSITLNTGASLAGRAWALTGAVTLDNNAVNPN